MTGGSVGDGGPKKKPATEIRRLLGSRHTRRLVRRARQPRLRAEGRLADDAHNACASYGLQPNSRGYNQCIGREIDARRYQGSSQAAPAYRIDRYGNRTDSQGYRIDAYGNRLARRRTAGRRPPGLSPQPGAATWGRLVAFGSMLAISGSARGQP